MNLVYAILKYKKIDDRNSSIPNCSKASESLSGKDDYLSENNNAIVLASLQICLKECFAQAMLDACGCVSENILVGKRLCLPATLNKTEGEFKKGFGTHSPCTGRYDGLQQ